MQSVMAFQTEPHKQFSDAINALRGNCSEREHRSTFSQLRFGGERAQGRIVILLPRWLIDHELRRAGVLLGLKRTYLRDYGIDLQGICKTRTEVVNIKHVGDRWDTYIGRQNSSRGLGASEWANPFKLKRAGNAYKTRMHVVQEYREWIVGQPVFAHIAELQGLRLACWCHPQECHGDVLAELADATLRQA